MANDLTLSEKRRLELHALFETITPNVYFEPPESIKLKYPCITYERTSGKTDFANNKPYVFRYRYTVTVITRDPDSDLPEKLAANQYCTLDRGYPGDGLYHYVFTVY